MQTSLLNFAFCLLSRQNFQLLLPPNPNPVLCYLMLSFISHRLFTFSHWLCFFCPYPSLRYTPVFSLVTGGSWEQPSCNSRCLHIWTRWWNRGMRLSHDPPIPPSLPSIHPFLLPCLFCAIILVQGVPHPLPLFLKSNSKNKAYVQLGELLHDHDILFWMSHLLWGRVGINDLIYHNQD